jgi:hypothetical protein
VEVDPGKGGSPLIKVCGCYLLPSSCSLTSTDPIRCPQRELVLSRQQKLFEIQPDGKSGLPCLLALVMVTGSASFC